MEFNRRKRRIDGCHMGGLATNLFMRAIYRRAHTQGLINTCGYLAIPFFLCLTGFELWTNLFAVLFACMVVWNTRSVGWYFTFFPNRLHLRPLEDPAGFSPIPMHWTPEWSFKQISPEYTHELERELKKSPNAVVQRKIKELKIQKGFISYYDYANLVFMVNMRKVYQNQLQSEGASLRPSPSAAAGDPL